MNTSLNRSNTIVLFDVDGTLTAARKDVTEDVLTALSALRKKVTIGFVGGSDLKKQEEQLGANGTLASIISSNRYLNAVQMHITLIYVS